MSSNTRFYAFLAFVAITYSALGGLAASSNARWAGLTFLAGTIGLVVALTFVVHAFFLPKVVTLREIESDMPRDLMRIYSALSEEQAELDNFQHFHLDLTSGMAGTGSSTNRAYVTT